MSIVSNKSTTAAPEIIAMELGSVYQGRFDVGGKVRVGTELVAVVGYAELVAAVGYAKVVSGIDSRVTCNVMFPM